MCESVTYPLSPITNHQPRTSTARLAVQRGGENALSRQRYLVASVCVAISASLPACGGDGESAVAEARQGRDEPPVVDCDSRLQVIPSRDDRLAPSVRRRSVFVGPVMFFGAKTWRNDPRNEFRPSRPGGRVPVKVPIGVDAERVVTLTLLRRTRRHAAIESDWIKGHTECAARALNFGRARRTRRWRGGKLPGGPPSTADSGSMGHVA
jgi:hypothetical protein